MQQRCGQNHHAIVADDGAQDAPVFEEACSIWKNSPMINQIQAVESIMRAGEHGHAFGSKKVGQIGEREGAAAEVDCKNKKQSWRRRDR